jgi:hypothetical protein
MGVPAKEVGYTSVTTGRGDHEVHKGHVVALEKNIATTKFIDIKKALFILVFFSIEFSDLFAKRKANRIVAASYTHLCMERGSHRHIFFKFRVWDLRRKHLISLLIFS